MHLVAAHSTMKTAVVDAPIHSVSVDLQILDYCHVLVVDEMVTISAKVCSSAIGFHDKIAAVKAELDKLLQPARIVIAAQIP